MSGWVGGRKGGRKGGRRVERGGRGVRREDRSGSKGGRGGMRGEERWEGRKEWVCRAKGTQGGMEEDWKKTDPRRVRLRKERGARSEKGGGSMLMSMLPKPLSPWTLLANRL